MEAFHNHLPTCLVRPARLSAEQFLQLILPKLRTDDAELSCDFRLSCPDVMFLGNIVKVDPCAVFRRHHALGAQDRAVFSAVQGSQDTLNALRREFGRRLLAPAGKYFIRMVVVMMLMAAAFLSSWW